MGLFDSITRLIRKESADIGDAFGDATESLDRDLARKERELSATPEERIGQLQSEIDDDPFAAIRDRIEASTAHAAAESEVDAIDGPVLDGSDAPGESETAEPETAEPETAEPETAEPETAEATSTTDGDATEDEA